MIRVGTAHNLTSGASARDALALRRAMDGGA